MAIGNVTPDSFYASSRLADPASVVAWAKHSLYEGADILDIGACSTRPHSTPVSEEEEWLRLEPAFAALRRELPDASLSLDTFRPAIARRALDLFGPMIINDVSGGCDDMYALVREKHVPYIWTIKGDYDLPAKSNCMGGIDYILDPGFGFLGSTERDYECLRTMERLKQYSKPLLVGISRKSMVYKPLGLTPETCLSATQALQLYALEHGATILRTHDIAATRRTIRLWQQLNGTTNDKW
ncbi:MAG: dihydropteroate synthase [Paludibacteraceae bacterium]|nr:dihydropteroate synthase [Paludibacteraceae bacterium]